jgi:hypothetical protein
LGEKKEPLGSGGSSVVCYSVVMTGKVVLCVFFVALAGCATVQVINTARSSIEERLLISSLERALAALSVESLQGKTVAIDFYGLTSDKDFAKEFCTAWLRGKQVHLATDAREADLRLKIFAPVLGVDQGGAFVGVPSVTVPVLGFTTPEVALFKSVTHQGRTAIQIYLFDEQSGQFIDKSPVGNGAASYDEYAILILIHYTRSDMDSQWQEKNG